MSYRSDLLKHLWSAICKYITLWLGENFKRYSTMMVLQRRNIVVTNRNFCSSIDLVPKKGTVDNIFLKEHLYANTKFFYLYRFHNQLITYVLLNPGWSRSWQMHAVMRTQRSFLDRYLYNLHEWIRTYIIWVTQKLCRKLWNGLFR